MTSYVSCSSGITRTAGPYLRLPLRQCHGCPVVGARVSVPFGKRKAIGIVVGLSDTSTFPLEQLKTIDAILDNHSLFPPSLWRILCWATEYYHYPIGEVLFHALPILLRQGRPAQSAPLWQWFVTEQGRATPPESLNARPSSSKRLLHYCRNRFIAIRLMKWH